MGEKRIIGQRVELPALHRDGHTFPVELSINRVETGGEPIFTGFIRDITKRKQAEAEILALNADLERRVNEATSVLRQQAEELSEANLTLTRFKAVADVTSDFVCIANLKAELIYMNPAGRALIGFGGDEDVAGLSYEQFASPDYIQRSNDGGFQIAMDKGSWQIDTKLLHRQGHEIPVSIVGLGIKSADGTPSHFAGVARDMTRRVAMESELRLQADQLGDANVALARSLTDERDLNELKTNFVNMISHEFRTPLGIIMSSTEILTKYFDRLPPELRNEHLNDVVVATRRMGVMMEEVLLLARVDAGSEFCKPEPLDLASFCRQLASDVDLTNSREFPIVVSSSIVDEQACADPTLLRHIFINLMNNAVKFSPDRSPVKLDLHRHDDDAVFVVSDQGMGIPPKDMAALFTAFHRGSNTSETSGTGLGLVIVKRCVTLHGGSIEVSSELGKGTTFTVRLPLFG
jgi:PAS domain S-box-containing protein